MALATGVSASPPLDLSTAPPLPWLALRLSASPPLRLSRGWLGRRMRGALIASASTLLSAAAAQVVPALRFELEADGCAASVAVSANIYLLSMEESGGGSLTYYEYTQPIDPNSEWKSPSTVNPARHRLRWTRSAAGAGAAGTWTLSLEQLKYPARWELLATTTVGAQPLDASDPHAALGGLIDSLRPPTSQCDSGAGAACQWALHVPAGSSGSPAEACFPPNGEFTAVRCCNTAKSSQGDSACWGGGYTFARCCAGPSHSSGCTSPVLAGSVAAAAAESLQEPHRVSELPGWTQPLPSKLFAGSVPVVESGFGRRYIHYMLAEAEHQQTSPGQAPDQVPVVLWLQGGPGCSAMSGMWTEVGPFQLRDGSSDTLERNPYSWTRFAHVLAIDAPIGVGWSSSEVEAGTAQHTDESTALLNWKFLQRWFSAFFPQLANNPFYIAGESYAGVFVPTLAEKIIDAHVAGEDVLTNINLRGIVVGNGCAGSATGLCGVDPANDDFKLDFTGRQLQLLYGRGLISSAVHDNILSSCDDPAKGFPEGYALSHGLPACFGITKEPLCGLQATEYFRSFVQWTVAMSGGDRSQMIPDCLGAIPDSVSGSSTEMAALDAMQLPGEIFGPLPPGYQAQFLLQLNEQIWPQIFGQLEEQSSDFLAQYSLTQDSAFLIGAPGATPVWGAADRTDPIGRAINIECCSALSAMTATVGLIDVYDTSDQQCKGGPLPSGTSTWHEATVKKAVATMASLKASAAIASASTERVVLQKEEEKEEKEEEEEIHTETEVRFDLDPCGGSFENLMEYFNSAPVVAALHAPFGRSDGVHGWGICTAFAETQGNYSYTKTVALAPYGKLLSSINVSIYSGDTDACVPFSATVGYFSSLASTLYLQSDEDWLPWLVDAQVGGYVTAWHDETTGSKLSVSTVRGAGHMVPSLRPKQALALLYRAVHQIGWQDEVPVEVDLSIIATGEGAPQMFHADAGGSFTTSVGNDVRFEVCVGAASTAVRCDKSPIDMPLVFRWSHNGRDLVEGGTSNRVSGAADAVLLASVVKPADAGDYAVEVWDVLGNSLGSMTLNVAVSLAQACATEACYVNAVGCPESWEGDGECDRALCPHGDAQDCDPSSGSSTGGACASYVDFAEALDAIRQACCDQADDDCSTGFPTVCDAGCSAVLVPAISACTTFLSGSTPEVAGIDGAGILTQLNQAAARCGGGKGSKGH